MIQSKVVQANTSQRTGSLQPVSIAQSYQQLWRIHRPLMLSASITLGLLFFFMLGIVVDSRVITGAPAWLKPAKFAMSISLYSFTLVWFIGFIDVSKRWRKVLVNVLGWTVVVTFAAEWFAIITQVIRGTSSHFNVATPLDAALWSLMGSAIVILWVANFVLAALLLLQRFENSTLGWSLRLGLIITIIGMGLGYLMTNPTAQQLASWEAGGAVNIVGAHSVGVVDGGEGLPVLNWSTEGGDLRVGHFVGMHALQVIPLLAWFVMRRRRLSQGQQLGLVWLGAVVYLGFTLLLTWQALRAQSIIAPDSLTIIVFSSLIALGALGTGVIIRSPRQV